MRQPFSSQGGMGGEREERVGVGVGGGGEGVEIEGKGWGFDSRLTDPFWRAGLPSTFYLSIYYLFSGRLLLVITGAGSKRSGEWKRAANEPFVGPLTPVLNPPLTRANPPTTSHGALSLSLCRCICASFIVSPL